MKSEIPDWINGLKGFSDGLGSSVETLAVSKDFIQCRDAVAAYLQKVQDLDTMMALGADGAEPALQALETMGKSGKIKFGMFDLSPAVLQALVKKQMDFALDQQQWLQVSPGGLFSELCEIRLITTK